MRFVSHTRCRDHPRHGGPNLDEAAADQSVDEIRAAIGGHRQNFDEQLSEEQL
jgi:hypothetical protein